jgi:site-specific DNA recombinase
MCALRKAAHRGSSFGRRFGLRLGLRELRMVQRCNKRHANMTTSLAWHLAKAAVEGRLPHGVGVAGLFDAPVAWSSQHRMLGLAN